MRFQHCLLLFACQYTLSCAPFLMRVSHKLFVNCNTVLPWSLLNSQNNCSEANVSLTSIYFSIVTNKLKYVHLSSYQYLKITQLSPTLNPRQQFYWSFWHCRRVCFFRSLSTANHCPLPIVLYRRQLVARCRHNFPKSGCYSVLGMMQEKKKIKNGSSILLHRYWSILACWV